MISENSVSLAAGGRAKNDSPNWGLITDETKASKVRPSLACKSSGLIGVPSRKMPLGFWVRLTVKRSRMVKSSSAWQLVAPQDTTSLALSPRVVRPYRIQVMASSKVDLPAPFEPSEGSTSLRPVRKYRPFSVGNLKWCLPL